MPNEAANDEQTFLISLLKATYQNIGCAYEGQMNRVLKSVCDRFIPIPAPQVKIEDIQVTEVTEDNSFNDEIFVKTNKILQELQQNSQQASQLQKAGISMSQIHQILRNNIPDFDEKWKKYNSKFTNFIKRIIEESNTGLDISNNKLIWKEKLNTISNSSSKKSIKSLTNSSINLKEIAVTAKV